MLCMWLFVAQVSAGLSPAEMADVVAGHLAGFDRVICDVVFEYFFIEGDAPTLDRSQWVPSDQRFPYRLTIVRPNLKIESLRDDPEEGYEPLVAYIYNHTYTRRSVRPTHHGAWSYAIVRGTPLAFSVGTHPLLQVFGFQILDSARWYQEFNVVSVLREPSARLVRQVGGLRTYTARARMGRYPYSQFFELDVGKGGLVTRMRILLDYDDPQLLDVTDEQIVLATTDLDGTEVPTETVVFRSNPKLPRSHVAMVYRVEQIERRPELTDEDVRFEVERRNAFVTEEDMADETGARIWRYYDAEGRVRDEDLLGPKTFNPDDPNELWRGGEITRSAQRWRWLIGPAAGVVGLLTAGGLAFVARRGARLPR